MKTLYCILLSFGFILLNVSAGHAQHYFWSGGKRNSLVPDSTILVLERRSVPSSQGFTKGLVEKIEHYGEYTVFRNVRRNLADSLRIKKIGYATAFRLESVPVIGTNVISLLPKNSAEEIERSFRNRIRFRDKTNTGVYHYTVNNFRETLDVANSIAESGLVKWCHPDFIMEVKVTTIDPSYNQQYYLNNTGQTGGVNNIDINAPEAWSITKGCHTTRVAVLDYGVEPHEELGARLQTGFTALNPSGTGLPGSFEYHGEACAGIIAASHDNNLGIAGVSPNSLIIPVNGVLDSKIPNSQVADGINAGWDPLRGNADVLSNSWTYLNSTIIDEVVGGVKPEVSI